MGVSSRGIGQELERFSGHQFFSEAFSTLFNPFHPISSVCECARSFRWRSTWIR